MDRAHRIGQKKVVNVYRLITRGTLEEKIMGYVYFYYFLHQGIKKYIGIDFHYKTKLHSSMMLIVNITKE